MWHQRRFSVSLYHMRTVAALLGIVVALSAGPIVAAETSATPEECIRNFYRWYVTNLVANRDPMTQRKEIRNYATERLLKEIDRMAKGPDGLDSDYFIDAQDFDPLWAKNISISAVQTQGDKSNAHVFLKGAQDMKRKLLVYLVREAGSWKVDKVKGLNR
jgi:hypothetical protein